MSIHQYPKDQDCFEQFRIKCDKCSGLCCTALYFSKFDGFPSDKPAGLPCMNLDKDFRCIIHGELKAKQMKGCLAYDCCGAGQTVTAICGSDNWSSNPGIAREIFDLFTKIFTLKQAAWYLTEVLTLTPAAALWDRAESYLNQMTPLFDSSSKEISDFDADEYCQKVHTLLMAAADSVRKEVCTAKKASPKRDFMGHNFKKAVLDGYDFHYSLLIAADLEGCSLKGSNFLGADLRDTNIRNADLSGSIFLTQGQLNAAQGNRNTRIPPHLAVPSAWK